MAKLKASILKEIKLNASKNAVEVIKASIKKTLIIYGSVTKFIQSFTIKAFIQPAFNIHSSAKMERNAKSVIESGFEVVSRMTGDKPAVATIEADVFFASRAYADKPIQAYINIESIIGHTSDIGFAENARAEILKKSSSDIIARVEMLSDTIKFRYRLLGEMDDLTLGELDGSTLGEIDIIIT